jgi:hypothetical protein
MTGTTPGPRDQAPGTVGQATGTADQDAENVRAAARLRDQRPGWVIVWAAPLRATPPRRYSARHAEPTCAPPPLMSWLP